MIITKGTLLWLLNECNFLKPFSYDDVLDSQKIDCFNEAKSLNALKTCGQVSNVGCKYCEDRHPILPSSKNEVFCPKYGKRFLVDENKIYLYSVCYEWLKKTLCDMGKITSTQRQEDRESLHLLGSMDLLYSEYLVYLYHDPDFSFDEFSKILNVNPIDDNSIILSLNDTEHCASQSLYNFINLQYIIFEEHSTSNAFMCIKTLENHITHKNRAQPKIPHKATKNIKKSGANNFPRLLIVWAITQLEEQGILTQESPSADLVSKTWAYLKSNMHQFSYKFKCGSIYHPIKIDHNGFDYNNSDRIQTTYKKITFDRFAKSIRKTYLSDYEKYKELLANQKSTKQ